MMSYRLVVVLSVVFFQLEFIVHIRNLFNKVNLTLSHGKIKGIANTVVPLYNYGAT